MSLRTATLADAPAIANIHTLSWRATYQQALSAQYLAEVVPNERLQVWNERLTDPVENQHVIVAEEQGEVVGFVCIYLDKHPKWGAYIDNLHVRADFQGKGIGKALLQAVAKWGNEKTSQSGVCLLVNQDNLNAQAFYLKLGARNADTSIWHAPDGTHVPTFWFVWRQFATLL